MTTPWSTAEFTAIRLKPNSDLKKELQLFAKEEQLEAAAIVTVVGSLSDVYLRLANEKEHAHFEGKHEIVSLTGTLSKHGAHLHMSVSSSAGDTIGGHVVEGSIVYTTAEIVIAKMNSLVFEREPCPLSGFRELVVKS